MPLVSRTRATLRSAELGFFGVWVKTRTQTPRFCGLSCSAGLLVLTTILARPLRTNWLIVGTSTPARAVPHAHAPGHAPGAGRQAHPKNALPTHGFALRGN